MAGRRFLGSAVVLFAVKTFTPIHFLLYPLIGYLVSVVFPVGRRNLDGLTIFTLPPRE